MIRCPICKNTDVDVKSEQIWCSTEFMHSFRCKNCGASRKGLNKNQLLSELNSSDQSLIFNNLIRKVVS